MLWVFGAVIINFVKRQCQRSGLNRVISPRLWDWLLRRGVWTVRYLDRAKCRIFSVLPPSSARRKIVSLGPQSNDFPLVSRRFFSLSLRLTIETGKNTGGVMTRFNPAELFINFKLFCSRLCPFGSWLQRVHQDQRLYNTYENSNILDSALRFQGQCCIWFHKVIT